MQLRFILVDSQVSYICRGCFTLYTERLLVPGHFYFYAVSKFLLRENDISILLL